MPTRRSEGGPPPAVVAVVMLASMSAWLPLVLGGTEGFGLGLDELLPPPGPSNPTQPGGHEAASQHTNEPVRLFPGSWDEPPSYPRRVSIDLLALVAAPVEWNAGDWQKLGLGVLAVGAVSLLDEDINRWLDTNRTESSVKLAESIRPLGQEAGLALLGAAWLGGRYFDRPELTAIGKDGLEAVLFSAGLITPAVKAITGRTRPRETDSAGQLGGSGHSFPSGESTMAFAIASVIAAHSDRWWVDAAAWGTAGILGFGRMQLDGHWASDVVAGALIGAAVGQWVVHRNRPELGSDFQMSLMPAVGTTE